MKHVLLIITMALSANAFATQGGEDFLNETSDAIELQMRNVLGEKLSRKIDSGLALETALKSLPKKKQSEYQALIRAYDAIQALEIYE